MQTALSTGLPEIGRFAYAFLTCTRGRALPVVSIKFFGEAAGSAIMTIAARMDLHRPTDFGYSRMKAGDAGLFVRT